VPVVGTMNRTSEARWRRADLGSPEESVAKADSSSITGVQVAPDGRTLVLWTERNGAGIWRAGINTQPWVQLVGNEGRVLQPTISPDGRWLAYVTDESGAMEVVVRPLDAAGGRVTISDGGGTEPVWDRRGNGLFYRNGNEFIRASLRFDPSLRVAGRSVVLRGAFGQWSDVGYDVTNDGERLLVTESITGGQLVIVVNWLGELRKRMN
jgi:Tol biopolymer transport system component